MAQALDRIGVRFGEPRVHVYEGSTIGITATDLIALCDCAVVYQIAVCEKYKKCIKGQ
jgi:hypothetical protein